MKVIFNRVVIIVLVGFFSVSCENSSSLQGYFVDHQEAKNFISQDIPITMLKLDASQFTNEQKEAYESVNRLNFLGYKANEADAETLRTELAKVKTILNDKKYNELMEFSDKGNRIVVKYLGNETEANEIVVFGSSKTMGFGIVRVLGNTMSPDKMVNLVSVLQSANMDETKLKEIMGFFK